MRQPFDSQLRLDIPRLDDVVFDLTSRHELEPILMALKHIENSREVLDQILALISKDVLGDSKPDVGCTGLTFWQVLVLAAVRLGCNLDYDALTDLANNHMKLRRVMGVGDWEADPHFSRSRINDNITALRPETLRAISNLIVAEGHKLKPHAIDKVRGDSVVVQTNIHYPTDASLIVDAVRKVLSLSAKLGTLFDDSRWQCWRRRLRNVRLYYNRIRRIAGRKSLNQNEKLEQFKAPYQELIDRAADIALEALEFKNNLKLRKLRDKQTRHRAKEILADLSYYLTATTWVVDLADRRVLNGETIPNQEKIHSIFEPHTQLINRGKFPYPIEFGHPVFFVEDRVGFILDYQIMKDGLTDEKVSVPLLISLQEKYNGKIKSASVDKASWTPENYERLKDHFEVACLPKKGKRNVEERFRESAPAFRKARRWHAGIESAIHALVDGNGLTVCRDKGELGYDRYVALGVLGRNLHTLGRILLKQARRQKPALRKAA